MINHIFCGDCKSNVLSGAPLFNHILHDCYYLTNIFDYDCLVKSHFLCRLPLPPGALTTLWRDDNRFINAYHTTCEVSNDKLYCFYYIYIYMYAYLHLYIYIFIFKFIFIFIFIFICIFICIFIFIFVYFYIFIYSEKALMYEDAASSIIGPFKEILPLYLPFHPSTVYTAL